MAEFCECGSSGCALIVNVQRAQSRDKVVATLPTLEQRVADLERTVETLKRRLDLQTRRFR